RGGRPRVHYVGVANEASRSAALTRIVAARDVGRRIHGELILGCGNRPVILDFALGVHRVPYGKRHAEEALAADAPIAVQSVRPVFIPGQHVRRVPPQRAATREKRLTKLQGLDEPLAAGDDLEWTITLFVKLDRMLDRPGLSNQITGCLKQFHDL